MYHYWKKLIRDVCFFFFNFLLKPLVGVKGLRKRMVSLWCHIYTSDCLLYLIGNGQAGSRSPLTTFQDAVRHCQTASYLEQHMSHIKPTIKHRGMAAVTNKLFGPPSMNSSLHMERNLIFALALCMFKNDEPMHNHVLQTIYKKLTGTKLDCPRYGNHWELIGFQGAQFTYMYMYILCMAKMAMNKIKLKSQFFNSIEEDRKFVYFQFYWHWFRDEDGLVMKNFVWFS